MLSTFLDKMLKVLLLIRDVSAIKPLSMKFVLPLCLH